DAREAVVARIDEGAFDGHLGVADVVCAELVEFVRVAFDQQRRPAIENERARVGKVDSVPGAVLAAEPVPGPHDIENPRDDVFLTVLRDALAPIINEGFHLPREPSPVCSEMTCVVRPEFVNPRPALHLYRASRPPRARWRQASWMAI